MRFSSLPLASLLALAAATPAIAVPVGTSADTRPAAPQQRTQWKDGGFSLQVTGNYLRGNVNLSTLNTSLSLNLNRGPHQYFLDAGNVYTGSGATTLVNRLAGSGLYAYAFADNQNLYAYNTSSHDASIKLDFRNTTGLGWCVHRLAEPHFSLLLLSFNPAYEYEVFQGGSVASTWRGVARLNAIKPLGETVEAGFDGFYSPAVTDLGDTRVYGEAYLKTKLIGDLLSLKLTVADEYDTRPQAGVQENDFGVFTTIGIEWGQ